MDGEKDPDELFKKAKKKLDPGFFKSIFSDTVHRYEKAITYFNEAAEIYKLKKEWIKAGDSFIEVAKLKELLKEDACEAYNSAILCYNKGGAKDKYSALTDKIISINLKEGQFAYCAELTFDKAQKLLESANNDPKKIEEVLAIYDKALDYYEMDKNPNEAKVNMVKEAKADLICINGFKDEIAKAKSYYEEIAYYNLRSNTGRIFSCDLFTKIIFIYLAYDDYTTARAFLNKYYGDDKNFRNSEVAYFIENLIKCFENDGVDFKDEDIDTDDNILNFDVACKLYKKRNKKNKNVWDNWKEVIIKKIGEKLEKLRKEKEDFDDDDLK